MSDMRILSVSISEFGGLRDFRMDFSEGLNIIRGDNEAGKSTVLLFVSYMLYGLVSSTKDNNDKDKSLSWSGNRAEGSMEIESGGRKYRIYRINKGKGTKTEVSVTDIDTGARVDIAQGPGVFFLGLSRKAFESCVWCGQTRVASVDGASVSETLSNLSLTADESVNAGKVLDRIRKAKKEYRLEKGDGGLIYETEKKRAEARLRESELRQKVEENLERKRRYRELCVSKEEASSELAEAEALSQAANTLKILERIRSLEKRRAETEKNKDTLAALADGLSFYLVTEPDEGALAELRHLSSELSRRSDKYNECKQRSQSETRTDTRAAETARKISERESESDFCGRIEKSLSRVSGLRLAGAVQALVGIGACVGGAILLGEILCYILFAVFGIFAVLSALSFIAAAAQSKRLSDELSSLGTDTRDYRKFIEYCFAQLEIYEKEKEDIEKRRRDEDTARANLESARAEAEDKLAFYGYKKELPLERGLSELIRDIEGYLERKKTLVDRIKVDEGISEIEKKQLSEYDADALRRSLPEGITEDSLIKEESAAEKLERARTKYQDICSSLSALEAKIEAYSDGEDGIADVQKEIEAYKRLIGGYRERYAVLDRAYSALEEAYGNMRSNFAPKVREGAGEYLGAISGGRYSRVLLSEKMDVSVDLFGRAVEARNLSGGTADAVYISLRLSLAEQIFGGAVPLFMDETLSQLDDTRAESVLRLIEKFVAKGNQCLLFSCHKREAELCDSLGIAYNRIEL